MMSALVPNSTLASKVATPVKVEVSSTVSVPFTVVAEPETDISTSPPAKVIFPVVGENTLNAVGVGVLRRAPPNVLVLENVAASSTVSVPSTVVGDPATDMATAAGLVDIGAPICTEDPPRVINPVVVAKTL